MMESGASGDVRIAWMQTSGGGNVDAWNTIYRRSSDGGATWSAPVRISDATSGAPYKTAAGYAEVYGDYGEMGITNTGKTIADMGRGDQLHRPRRRLGQPRALRARQQASASSGTTSSPIRAAIRARGGRGRGRSRRATRPAGREDLLAAGRRRRRARRA